MPKDKNNNYLKSFTKTMQPIELSIQIPPLTYDNP